MEVRGRGMVREVEGVKRKKLGSEGEGRGGEGEQGRGKVEGGSRKGGETKRVPCIITFLFVQMTCSVCGRVSEREEEFLDLPVALSGHSGLEQTLSEAYIKQELLEGTNQYFCGQCQKLVDATRVCAYFFVMH